MPILRIKDNVNLQDDEYQIKSYDKVLKKEKINTAENNIFQELILIVVNECKKNYSNILNKQLVKLMMDNLKLMYPGEIDGIIPEKIDYLVLLEIMKGIIKRNGNIRCVMGTELSTHFVS